VNLGLRLDADREAVREAVATFCRERWDDERRRAAGLDRALWKELAELGALAVATPEGDGGPLELVAVFEALGHAAFPGPLLETVIAGQLLPAAERATVAGGGCWVAVGSPPLLAFAPEAELFLALEGGEAWLGRPTGPMEPVVSLAGDPWGRVALTRERSLGDARPALVLGRVASAAYLAAAGRRLVEEASRHARTRKQFGRALGEFQAVAHPLADASIRLSAAEMLARVAGRALAEEPEAAPALAAAARLSARDAALQAAYTAHQVFGAVGITLEGPVFHVSSRIRQLASWPLDDAFARECLLAGGGASEWGPAGGLERRGPGGGTS